MQYSGISEERHERANVLQQHFDTREIWFLWNFSVWAVVVLFKHLFLVKSDFLAY